MDTKSKSFKYSQLSKGMCLFFAFAFAILSAWCGAAAAGKVLLTGDFSARAQNETAAFTQLAGSEIEEVTDFLSKRTLLSQFEGECEKCREKNVNAVLEKYKNDDYDYAGDEQGYTQKIYFPDEDFFLLDCFDYWDVSLNQGLSDAQALKQINAQYSEYVESNLSYLKSSNMLRLSDGTDYYIVTADGEVITNCPELGKDTEKIKKEFENSAVWLAFENGKLRQQSLDNVLSENRKTYFDETDINALKRNFTQAAKDAAVYLKFDTDNGIFERLNAIGYYFSSFTFTFMVICALLALIAAVIFLVAFARLSGRYGDGSEARLSVFDKIPTDIHFIFSTAFVAAFAVGTVLACVYGLSLLDLHRSLLTSYFSNLLFTKTALFICALCGGFSFLFFALWVASVSRIKKSGKSFFAKFIIVYIIKGIIISVRFIKEKIKDGVKAAVYKPKKFKRWVIAAFLGVLALDWISANISFHFAYSHEDDLVILFGIPVVLINLAVIYFIISYLMKLDEIIAASEEKRKPNLVTEKLPVSLKALTDSITVTNAQLECAIEQALKDERMKTELITNVSHDLKTPLTSIISYVELLGRCDIADENAKQYIAVLEEKSARLKTLVDDLVEASKASSGAVTLDKTGFDLTELVLQVVGETSDDFTKSFLELIFNEPSQRPKVYADSRKTYRVAENLFSNARKYSVPGSRVYVSVGTENGMGCMQIKNMSKQMLNITPDELTERFVRGDSSRTDGGSGLGLAIAKDLCTLQDGQLKIEIDGDLFKATVYLPLYGA
ncbi:MAG: HAMP domain-containing histidine kinase [Clostridia bacterium]|nr:HAMP domain-containing histidine kinase [Clostridia bacterium]